MDSRSVSVSMAAPFPPFPPFAAAAARVLLVPLLVVLFVVDDDDDGPLASFLAAWTIDKEGQHGC